uniref:Uncharacterized protein n=1 Tax=Cucumis melo TaxID=3656 RepID=A0A9I9EA39_CUCME
MTITKFLLHLLQKGLKASFGIFGRIYQKSSRIFFLGSERDVLLGRSLGGGETSLVSFCLGCIICLLLKTTL